MRLIDADAIIAILEKWEDEETNGTENDGSDGTTRIVYPVQTDIREMIDLIANQPIMAFPKATCDIKSTCDLNYEAEYNRLMEENSMLKEENHHLHSYIDEIVREKQMLEAKMSVVEMIFGNRR